MNNVVKLNDIRRKKLEKDAEKVDDTGVIELEEEIKRNKKKEEKLREERHKANQSVVSSYRLNKPDKRS
jgi:hypothetical protein